QEPDEQGSGVGAEGDGRRLRRRKASSKCGVPLAMRREQLVGRNRIVILQPRQQASIRAVIRRNRDRGSQQGRSLARPSLGRENLPQERPRVGVVTLFVEELSDSVFRFRKATLRS